MRSAARTALLEDTFQEPFALYALARDPRELLDAGASRFLEELGCAYVSVGAEHDRIYEDRFAEHGCELALVRPDFYVFGTAAPERAALAVLVAELRSALTDPDNRQ